MGWLGSEGGCIVLFCVLWGVGFVLGRGCVSWDILGGCWLRGLLSFIKLFI